MEALTHAAIAAYDSLLESIANRSEQIGDQPVVLHWPHVGSAYRGLVIVGQAVYGWPDDFQAAQFRSSDGRTRAIDVARARSDRPEPLDWIATNSVRNSPFWTTARLLAEDLEEDVDAPWYARIAWVNLYPAAPENPPGNPTGTLREAEDPHVGSLLRTTLDMLNARTVVAFVGPYWWPTGWDPAFAELIEQPRPILRAGLTGDRTWVVGWHPGGASRRGFGPARYARIVGEVIRASRSNSPRS